MFHQFPKDTYFIPRRKTTIFVRGSTFQYLGTINDYRLSRVTTLGGTMTRSRESPGTFWLKSYGIDALWKEVLRLYWTQLVPGHSDRLTQTPLLLLFNEKGVNCLLLYYRRGLPGRNG